MRANYLYNIEQIEDFERALGLSLVYGSAPEITYKKADEFFKTVGDWSPGPDDLYGLRGPHYFRKIRIEEGGSRACYIPDRDLVEMPKRSAFIQQDEETAAEAMYWSTLSHESIHWTGHKGRLDRLAENPFSSDYGIHYATEEIVAELGSVYLCAHLGIEKLSTHADYISSWASVLRRRTKELYLDFIDMSFQAKAAYDYLVKLKNDIEQGQDK